MCGIAGYWSDKGADAPTAEKIALQIRHRGPDDTGVWIDREAGLALAHRRLSIIDLSPAGRQPMVSMCGRYVIVYNGEVYNYQSIRKELEALGHGFRGQSDTEVILSAISQWGVERAVKRFNGMFAFALWDRQERQLSLVRDRIGIKPLYYGRVNGAFVFGSELKAIRAFPGFNNPVDRNSLTLYLRHNYIPAPYSIYQGIFKLEPGRILTIDRKGKTKSICYWSAPQVVEDAIANPFTGNESEAIDELDAFLRDSINLRMISDVPLGAFLSGGFDSSTVVALMQAQSSVPVKTFTIGFYEGEYNEAEDAKKVAQHLGTEHTELYVTPEEAMEVIPRLPEIYDEPFSDSSQIPTYLVSKLTRQHVTVSLSGDGGDELFFGYERYWRCYKVWRVLGMLPVPIREALGSLLQILPAKFLENLENLIQFLPERLRISHLADRVPKLAEILKEGSGEAYYHQLVSHWKNPALVVVGGEEPRTLFSMPERLPKFRGLQEYMMYLDAMTYLPDDILTKVDRASMAVSLEARVPILDHRVVEFAWSLPLSMKVKNGKGKWILRKLLYRYVPKELVERPKMGFGVPIEHWLRGPLRDWAETLLEERRLREEGFFNPEPIRRGWEEHLSGKRRWHYYLWDVLMFQAWLERWG